MSRVLNCANCIYFAVKLRAGERNRFGETFSADLGECRRHAPRPATHSASMWPRVDGLMWCGDGKLKVDG